jgi:hypothetical protein
LLGYEAEETEMRHDTARSLFLCALLAVASPAAARPPVVAQPVDTPTGAAADASAPDPDYEPRNDPNSPLYDPDYDPTTDPLHPLKSQEDPGEAWNRSRRADGTPAIKVMKGDWEWGELRYGQSLATSLFVSNECDSTEQVTIEVRNLPYLTLQSTARIPGRSQVQLPATIATPPPPGDLFLTGHEELGPDAFFVDIHEGTEVVIWHPWNPPCLPKRTTYHVTGHIHLAPQDAGPKGPEKLFEQDDCVVYWNTGQPPARLEEDCTERIRVLAVHYREQVLRGYAQRAPEDWSWLPSAAEIRDMSIPALLGMKERAGGVIARADGRSS